MVWAVRILVVALLSWGEWGPLPGLTWGQVSELGGRHPMVQAARSRFDRLHRWSFTNSAEQKISKVT